MLSAIRRAFAEAFRNLRTNFFQTFLSVLGIIIGVGALVAMLSLIDGLELMAKEKLADVSSLENMIVSSETEVEVDGISTQRDSIIVLDGPLTEKLSGLLPYPHKIQRAVNLQEIVPHPVSGADLGVYLNATTLPRLEAVDSILYGRDLTEEDGSSRRAVLFVNEALAKRITIDSTDAAGAVGRSISFFGKPFEIVGVFFTEVDRRGEARLLAATPLLTVETLEGVLPIYPLLNLAFESVEDVLPAQEILKEWVDKTYPALDEPLRTQAQVGYLKEINKGFALFRLVMSFLIGIAVVVGGVGVMNVLLMSVAERTAEIGIRKALGANRRTIIIQFLSESIAVAAIGSVLGLILGMIVAWIGASLLTWFTGGDIAFRAVLSGQTMLVVGTIALLTGIIFGTYPARKAAGMDPVTAIQRS
ncbi:MAG: ABC transporter permease [Saprospiraceae bacterium]